MIQRSSILINNEDYEEIDRQMKEYQEVIAQELSQKKLATSSSIWERTNSQENTGEFISIGGETLKARQVHSEPFIPPNFKK